MTGGAGFIGSNFVSRTIERNNFGVTHVTVLDNFTYAGSLQNLAESLGHIELIKGSISDFAIVEKAVAAHDVIINFAAESHNDNSLRDPKIFFETNVMGTLNLVNACVKHDKRFHHISTDEVFGDLALDSEDFFDVASPYNPSSPYSASKASSDHIVRAWVRSYGLPATISNCSNNYGIRQNWEKLIPKTILLCATGQGPQLYGNGNNIRDWIHVNDHVDGIWSVIQGAKIGDTYLLGSRDLQSNVTIVKKILEFFDMESSQINYVDDRPGHDKKYALDPSLAEKVLGWMPKHASILDEIHSVIPWYLESLRLSRGTGPAS